MKTKFTLVALSAAIASARNYNAPRRSYRQQSRNPMVAGNYRPMSPHMPNSRPLSPYMPKSRPERPALPYGPEKIRERHDPLVSKPWPRDYGRPSSPYMPNTRPERPALPYAPDARAQVHSKPGFHGDHQHAHP